MIDTRSLQESITKKLYLSDQIDSLHASLSSLQELIKEGSIELILEQQEKSLKQKVKYIEKIIDELPSDELTDVLDAALEEGDIELFTVKYISDFIKGLQKAAESIKIISMEVAIEFKEKDLQEMAATFAKQIGEPVAFDIKVTPSLIGGAVIRFGNYISDYSLKSRLEQFTDSWETAALK